MDSRIFVVGMIISLVGAGGILNLIPFPGAPIKLGAVAGCPDLNCATSIGSIGFSSYYAPVNSLTPLQVGIQSAPVVVTFTKAPGITLTSWSIMYCYGQNPCTPTTALTTTIAYATGFSGGYITSSALTLSQNTYLLISITDSAGAVVTATAALTYSSTLTIGTAVITVLSSTGVPVSGASVIVTPSSGGSPVTGTTAGVGGTVSFSLAQGAYSASASAIAVGTGTTTFSITGGVTTNAAITLGNLATSTTSVSCGSVTSNGAGGTTTCTATVTGSNPSGTVTWSQSGQQGLSSFFPTSCTLVSGSCTTQYTGYGASTTVISAAYSGNIYNSVSSGSATVIITSQATTISTVGCTPSFQLNSGQSVVCTDLVTMATGSAVPTGTVTWSSNGGGTFTAPGTTCTLASGSCSTTYTQTGYGTATITASYGGSTTLAGSSGTTNVNYGTQSTCTVYLTSTQGDGTSTFTFSGCFGSTTVTTTTTVSSTTTIVPFSCTTDILHAAVSVLVQDGTQKPIAGAQVTMSGVGGQTVTTNANGLACLSGILTFVGGSVSVSATASGFSSATASIPVQIASVSTYTFTLQSTGCALGPLCNISLTLNPYALLLLVSGIIVSFYGAIRKRGEG